MSQAGDVLHMRSFEDGTRSVCGAPASAFDVFDFTKITCTICRYLVAQSGQADLPSGTSIQARFEVFHQRNPWVYWKLVDLAEDFIRRGYQRCGIKMLFEVVRYSWMTTYDPSSDFKLNNNYHSRYVRRIVEEHIELRALFELRELKAP